MRACAAPHPDPPLAATPRGDGRPHRRDAPEQPMDETTPHLDRVDGAARAAAAAARVLVLELLHHLRLELRDGLH